MGQHGGVIGIHMDAGGGYPVPLAAFFGSQGIGSAMAAISASGNFRYCHMGFGSPAGADQVCPYFFAGIDGLFSDGLYGLVQYRITLCYKGFPPSHG